MTGHRPDPGGGYTVSWSASTGPSGANSDLTNQQIEAIFQPHGKAPIDDYIGKLRSLADKWKNNTVTLRNTVSDKSQGSSLAGLVSANTGDLKWTGTAAGDYQTKATATAAYGEQVAGAMPKIHTALSGLADNLNTSRNAFQPIFDAWGTPGSGSKATVPHAMSTLLKDLLPGKVQVPGGDKEQWNTYSDQVGPMSISAQIYIPANNMRADPGNPYIACFFDVSAPDDPNHSGNYGYSGILWCSYTHPLGAKIEKYEVWDSSNSNIMVSEKNQVAFTPQYFQQHFWQQYNTHLLDLMTTTGKHFEQAQSQFPPLPQPDKALRPPTNTGTGPGGPGGPGSPGAPGLGGGPKMGSPGAPGLKQPSMPKTPTGLHPSAPPPNHYHLPTPTPPPKGLPGPGAGGLPGGHGGLPGGGTGLPNPPGSVGGGFPTPTGLVNTGPGTPGYTSTQTAGFSPNQLPTLASGLPTGGLGGGLGPGGTAAGLPGGLPGLGAAPGALGGFGGGAANAGSSGLSLGTTASGAPLAAGETAAARGALGEQAAMAEAGAAGRMPMMPPMAPMGMNNGNGDRNRKSWLPEEEDLWGLAEGSAAPPVIGSEL